MRRHGATVAGTSLREMTFRTVYSCENAALQSQAMAHGHVDHLSPGEIDAIVGAQRAAALDQARLELLGAPRRKGGADAGEGRREQRPGFGNAAENKTRHPRHAK